MRVRSTLAIGLFFAGLVCGCEEKRPGEVPVYPVTGRVTYGGEPMSYAVLSFFPESDPSPGALISRAYADKDGVYELTTYELKDGAPAGEYRVTLWWPEAELGPDFVENGDEPDRLKRKYFRRSDSKLRYTVKPEPNTIDIALPPKEGS